MLLRRREHHHTINFQYRYLEATLGLVAVTLRTRDVRSKTRNGLEISNQRALYIDS